MVIIGIGPRPQLGEVNGAAGKGHSVGEDAEGGWAGTEAARESASRVFGHRRVQSAHGVLHEAYRRARAPKYAEGRLWFGRRRPA